MTEINLLDGLAKETREALSGFLLRSAKDSQIPINVYVQNPPVKKEKDDENLYPYVLIALDREEIEHEEDPMCLYVDFEIGIIDRNEDKQGFRDVMQIANLIYQHIFRKGIVADAFSPGYPFRIHLQSNDTYPYFYGGIESRWDMPVFEMEDHLI